MQHWVLAIVAVALVVGVLGFSVLSASAAVESRALIVGFLAFFAVSLIAGAGLLPTPQVGEETVGQFQSAFVVKANGDSR